MITPSQSSEGVPSVPSPLGLTTPTSELTLNPLETALSNSGTKSRSGSVSVLKSSRPAPPSPASSRPGSQQFFHSPILTPSSPRDRSGSSSSSRMGISMQRKVSGASSRQSEWDKDGGKPSRRKSTLGQNFSLPSDEKDDGLPPTSTGNSTSNDTSLSTTPIPEDAIEPSPPASAASPTKQDTPAVVDTREIKIRDYGFPANDERFLGKGQPPPKQKWRMSSFNLGGRRASESASGDGSPRSPDPSEDDRKTWGFGLFGWRGFGKRRTMSNDSGSAGGAAINDEPEDTDDVVEEEDYFSDEQEEEHQEEGEEPSGTYRVMYPFVSEGANEMSVDEGEILQVTGRGGGNGWVVAEKQGQSGLVPEAYLERIGDRQGDIEEEEEEEGVVVAEKTTATAIGDQAKDQAKE